MATDPTGISPSDPGPASASADGMSVQSFSIADQIARDRYLKAKAARGKKGAGLIFGKILPAAAPADQQGTGVPGSSFDNPGF